MISLVAMLFLGVAQAQTDSTGGGGVPLPAFSNIWSVVFYVASVFGIPFLVDKLAPVTMTGTQKTLLIGGLAVVFSVLQLLADGKFDAKNLLGTVTSMMGFIQIWYQVFAKKIGLTGPKEKIMDIAKAQLAHQVDKLSHAEAKAVVNPQTDASVVLSAQVK